MKLPRHSYNWHRVRGHELGGGVNQLQDHESNTIGMFSMIVMDTNMSDLAADEISSFKGRQVMLQMSQSLSETILDSSEILKDDSGLLFTKEKILTGKRFLSSDKTTSWSTVSDAELDLNN